MANLYRNEVVLKGTDASIHSFINKYFSVEQEQKFIDFEKFLSLNGKQPRQIWHSDSEAFHFEVVRAESGIFKFRFDTKTCPPTAIFTEITKLKPDFKEVIITACCEQLSEIFKIEAKQSLYITTLQWGDQSKLSRKIIKKIAADLWGYSKRPNLEEQGFVHVGGGQYMKFHAGIGFDELYPRFKKA
ncbi:hypothetical protein ABEH28_13160 [Pseudomonas sp. Ps21-P2]|uniref:hypothetical protein n=1 Tax=Pseudomonas sp. Ps21-P2 TaxID=3080331 RepID=UPI003209D0A8